MNSFVVLCLLSFHLSCCLGHASITTLPDSKWPNPTGLVKFDAPHIIHAGQVFDGQMKIYERSNSFCQDPSKPRDITERGSNETVFVIHPGGIIRNVIIGANQMDGIHCLNQNCQIQNVWWEQVCTSALTIKGKSLGVTIVTGGGAKNAVDKIFQQNAPGSFILNSFYVQDFDRVYRSCGTCGQIKRQVFISNVIAVNPRGSLVTVNANFGDEARIHNVNIYSSKKNIKVCTWSQGIMMVPPVGFGEEQKSSVPIDLGTGPLYPICQLERIYRHLVKLNETIDQF